VKKIGLLTVALVVAAMTLSNGVKAQHPPYPPTQVRELETVSYGRLADYSMKVICDAPRGNIVYVTTGAGGNTMPIAVAAVHQPELCK
jgi:hypothetical protein